MLILRKRKRKGYWQALEDDSMRPGRISLAGQDSVLPNMEQLTAQMVTAIATDQDHEQVSKVWMQE